MFCLGGTSDSKGQDVKGLLVLCSETMKIGALDTNVAALGCYLQPAALLGMSNRVY